MIFKKKIINHKILSFYHNFVEYARRNLKIIKHASARSENEGFKKEVRRYDE